MPFLTISMLPMSFASCHPERRFWREGSCVFSFGRYCSCCVHTRKAGLLIGRRRYRSRPRLAVQLALADAEAVHVVEALFRLRKRRALGELHRLFDLFVELVDELLLPGVGPEVVLLEVTFHCGDRIFGLPVLNFLRGAIGAGVNHGVPEPAIGLAFNQGRSAASPGSMDGLAGDPVYS